VSSQTHSTEFEPPEADSEPAWEPDSGAGETQHSCLDCGAAVTAQYARVMGDNSGQVHACPECSLQRERLEGATGGAGR
jgi:DNA-directed RNA polymerase subunit RPC12/RpoP